MMSIEYNRNTAKKCSKSVLCLSFLLCLLNATSLFAIDSLKVQWSTFVGGSEGNEANEIVHRLADQFNEMASDSSGNLFGVGFTRTTNLPAQTNQHPSKGAYRTSAFVTRIDTAGNIIWTTYVGCAGPGPREDRDSQGNGIAIDQSGEFVYITGYATSDTAFPGLIDPGWATFGGAFVSKLATSTGRVVWSRFLTDNWFHSSGYTLCVKNDVIFVTGYSDHFHLRGVANENEFAGECDAFISKLSTDGTVLKSVWYGGQASDYGQDIFVDKTVNIFVAGRIWWYYAGGRNDYGLPEEKNLWNGNQGDGFVCRLNSDLDVVWSLYIGGSGVDECNGVVGDDARTLYVVGASGSYDINGPVIDEKALDNNGFLTRMDKDGNVLWSSYDGIRQGGGSHPVLTPHGKLITVSGGHIKSFDASLGNHDWSIWQGQFLPHGSVVALNDIFLDEWLNLYFIGYAPPDNTDLPNRTNEHSGNGYDGVIIKTSPKGQFFHFKDGSSPLGWEPDAPECWSVSDDIYLFTGKGGNYYRNVWYETDYYNFTFELDTRKISGSTTGSYGINLRKNRLMHDNYLFGIMPDGTYFIDYWEGGVRTGIVDVTPSGWIKTGLGEYNTLKVNATGEVIRFFVNGKEIETIENAPLHDGRPGIYAVDTNEGNDVIAFDNFYINPLPGDPPEPLIVVDGIQDTFYESLTGPEDGYVQIRNFHHSAIGRPVDDTDLSAKLWSAWDDTWFYLYAEVTDDTISVANTANFYRNDCLELKVDGQPTDSTEIGGPPNGISLTATVTALDSSEAEADQKTNQLNEIAVVNKQYARANMEGGYILELAVKLNALGGSEPIQAAVGEVFGLGINIVDNDGMLPTSNRQAAIVWAAELSDNIWNTPKMHGTVRFLENNKLEWTAENKMTGKGHGRPYDGSDYVISAVPDQSIRPFVFALEQNYPNPFNLATTIHFQVPGKSHVEMKIVDVQGKEIITLFDGVKAAGQHQVEWHGQDRNGQVVASGLYFCVMKSEKFIRMNKLILLK